MNGGISGTDIALIIGAVATLITALASSASIVIGALNTIKLNKTAAQVEKIEVATNSLTDRLVASTAAASHAEGRMEGKKEERTEQTAKRETEKDPKSG